MKTNQIGHSKVVMKEGVRPSGIRSMTKDDLNKLIATYIVAIGPAGAPNSHVWMAIDSQMSDLDRHQAILGSLKQVGLVKESSYFLTLTEKGLAMFRKLAELYKMTPEKPPVTT
jgi:predicted methyltransferase